MDVLDLYYVCVPDGWVLRLLNEGLILHVLITWLIGLCAASTAQLLFGCLAGNANEAMQAASAIFVPQILFAGLFVKVDQIPIGIHSNSQ
jgi:hypothetical protein